MLITYVITMVQTYLATLNLKHEEGQGMAEYGLILALVAVAVIVGFGLLGDQISGVLVSITDAFSQ